MRRKFMKPVKFKGRTGVAAGEGYFDLPVFKNDFKFVSCWRIPFLKRLKVLCTGKIWLELE